MSDCQMSDGRISHSFMKPLTLEQSSTVDLLIERYQGKDGEAFIRFEDDDFVTLVIPRAGIERRSFDASKSVNGETQQIHQGSN